MTIQAKQGDQKQHQNGVYCRKNEREQLTILATQNEGEKGFSGSLDKLIYLGKSKAHELFKCSC